MDPFTTLIILLEVKEIIIVYVQRLEGRFCCTFKSEVLDTLFARDEVKNNSDFSGANV